MELKEIDIDELENNELDLNRTFVRITFLYHPVVKELKRKEAHIRELYLTVNREMFETVDVLISLTRVFGIPREAYKKNDSFHLNYGDKTLEIVFSDSGQSFSGTCRLNDSELAFSENEPYIKVLIEGESDTVIVLPEGSGEYYMNLDKRESEGDNRFSIIGNPLKLKECYQWYKVTFRG